MKSLNQPSMPGGDHLYDSVEIVKERLEDLAKKMDCRALEMSHARAWSIEERAAGRSMVVIYSEIAAMIREGNETSPMKKRGDQ